MSDALDELVAGRSVVGVMGGHALERGTAPYADAARLGPRWPGRGSSSPPAAGPGAMEAANLGALCPDRVRGWTRRCAAWPRCRRSAPDVTAWAHARASRCGRSTYRRRTPHRAARRPDLALRPRAAQRVRAPRSRSTSRNAIREDGLLHLCNAGVVVPAGRRRAPCRRSSRTPARTTTPTAGRRPDGARRPRALDRGGAGVAAAARSAAGRAMEAHVHLVDTLAEAVALLSR